MLHVELADNTATVLDLPELASHGWLLTDRTDGQLDGWWSIDPRFEDVERPGMDGNFAPASLYVGKRLVTVNVSFLGDSHVEQTAAIDLSNALLKRYVRLIVTDGDDVRYAWAYISARTSVKLLSDTAFSASFILSCPDPLKYLGRGEGWDDWETATGRFSSGGQGGLLFPLFGQEARADVASTAGPTARFTESDTSNSVTIINAGQAATAPVLEAVGPFEWCEWRLGERIVRWESPVDEGLTLRINTGSGAITVGDSQSDASNLSVDDFFLIEPGENVVAFTADRSVTYRVRWQSAWI